MTYTLKLMDYKKKGFDEGLQVGRNEGIKFGIERGTREKTIEIAINLLKNNMTIDFIEKTTGLSSFEIETLELANEIFPDISRILLIDLEQHFGKFPSADEAALFCHQHKFSGISFKADFRADKSFVDALRSKGLRVVAWGVNTDEKGLAMADAGVDALTCNHAVALRKMAAETTK